ncbi:MAG: DUF2089 domain-containing protein [Dehalococcoidia bacterium]|nr:DUF2089 domain-containing protein [Dehalococcoidia bacterium]
MAREWSDLVRLSGGASLIVERARLSDSDIAIEGSFMLPPLAQLSAEDQIFVAAFVGCHGSIKDMERLFGISYPTVKSRLDKLKRQLKMVEAMPTPTLDAREDALEQLDKGLIDVKEALRRLNK